MSKIKLTGTELSSSLNSTGSFGRVNFDGAGGHTFIQETAADTLKIFVGGEAKMEFAEDSENIFMQANNYNFRDASFNNSFKIEANNHLLSGSITSTGSFGMIDTDLGGRIGTSFEFTPSGVMKFGASYGTGILTWDTGRASLYGTAGNKLQLGSNNTQGILTISSSHADTMVISGSNVGIGTASPVSKLHIDDATNYNMEIRRTSNNGIKLEAGSGSPLTSKIKVAYNDFSYIDAITIVNQTAGGYTQGNVGIGTTAPQSKLNINVAAESAIPSAGNDTTFLMIGNDGSGTTNYGTMIGTLNTGNGYIQQQRFDGTATTYNLLLQPNGGNVGIGTANPNDEKLLVAGDVGITGSLYVSGSIITSGSVIAREFKTEFISSSIMYASGSNKFGDSTDDKHEYTGSLNISASADTPAIQIGTGNIVRTGIKISDNRAQFGFDGAYAVVQGGSTKGVKLEVNNDTFGSGTEAVIVNTSANVGIGATEANIAARLEVQQSAGTAIMQLRPSDASSALNPLILYRSQLDGNANYFMAKGQTTYFATYDGATPTDESKMIAIAPNGTLSPQFFIGDGGSAVAKIKVGGDGNGIIITGGASGSLVSGSITSTGSFGALTLGETFNAGTAPPANSRLWVNGDITADLVSYDTNYYNHGYHEVAAPTSNSTIHLIHYGYYGQTFNTQGKDEALVISHSGDVGIHNPKPTEPLVVGGNVSASGNFITPQTGSFGIVEVNNSPGGDTFVLGHPAGKARLNYASAVFTFLDADNSYGSIAAESGSFYGDVGIRATKKLYFDDGEAPVAGGTYISETSDNILEFYTDNNPQLKISNSEGVVVNDGSYSSFDFRVESNNNTHALFVDSGNDKVGILKSNPGQALDVAGTIRSSGSYGWFDGGQGGSTDNVEVLRLGKMIDSPNNPLSIFYSDDNLDMIEYNILRYGGKYRFTRGSAAGGRVNMMTVEGNSTTEFKLWHQSNNQSGGSQTGSAVIFLNASTGSSGQSYIRSGGGLAIETGSVVIGGTSATNSKLNVKSEGSTQSVIRIDGDDGRGANRYALDIVDDDTNSRGSVRISTTSGPSIIATSDISGSLTSTGSFGHITGFNLGTGPNGINMNNTNIIGVNALTFADPGPGEGLTWSNFQVYESPNDLSTNSAGSIQFVSASVGTTKSRIFSIGRPHKINTGATYFRPTGSGNFAIISGSDGAFLMLDSSHSTNDKQVGGVFFNHTQGSADAHIHLAGIATYHESHATAGLGGGNLYFFTKNAGSNPGVEPRMVIRHNGNVGIGVTEPGEKLMIVDSGETLIKLYASTASTRSGIWFTNGSYSYGTNIGTDNKFHITGNVNSEGELFTINSSGYVGILTTSPDAPLHIANNVAAGGSLGSSAPFDSFSDYQILLYDTGNSATSYGLGITDNTMMFNSDAMYAFYVDNSKRVVIDTYGMQISGSTTSGRGVLDIEVQNGTYTDMDTAVRITNTHAEAEAGLALNTTGDALSSGITHNLTYDDNNARQPNSGRTSGYITFVGNATSGTNSRIALGGAPEGGNVTSAYMPDRFILDFDGDTKVVSGSFIVSESIKMNTGQKLYLDGGSNTYIHEQSSDDLEIVVGGDVLAKFEGDTVVLGGGYAVSSSLTFFGKPEEPRHMGYGEVTVAGSGWYRIATRGSVSDGSSNGGRASAKFTVYDTRSSRHSVVTFYASIHYGSNPTIRIMNSSHFSSIHGVVEQIRLVHGSTYEGVGLDVYINDPGSSTVRCVMEENYQTQGWVSKNFEAVAADPPIGYTMTQISCSYNEGGGQNNVIDGIAASNGNNTNGKVLSYTLANGHQMISGSDSTTLRVLDGSIATSDFINASGSFRANTSSQTVKYGLYGDDISNYGIGMRSGLSYGGLNNDWGMTFVFNDDADRGFHWRDSAHNDAQGAMSLTTDGKLVVATSISVGAGESTTSAAATNLDVNGTSNFTGEMYIDHGGSDYAPGINFMGGTNTPGSNTYENCKLAYYDNSGTGIMRYTIGRDAGSHSFRIGSSGEVFYVDASGQARITGATDINLVLTSTDSGGGLAIKDSGTSGDYYNGVFCSGNELFLKANNTERLRVKSGGDIDISNNLLFGSGNIWQLDQGSWTGGSANQGNIMLSGAAGTFGFHSNTSTVDILCDGNIRALADVVAYYSDIRLKEKFEPITNALEKVQSLQGFTYESNDLAKKYGYNGDYDNLTGKRKVGVSAQQVQEILPEAVTLAPFDTRKNEDGTIESISGENYLTVKYEKMVPLLIESIKELKSIVEIQQKEIEELKK